MAIFKSRKKSASASLQTKTATADTDDILVIPDTGYDGMSSVTVHPTPSETKTVTATTSQQTVTPTSGKYMSEVTVNPQAHTTTYTPSEDTTSNDMGANHDYRYVDTSGMITPTGTKSITSNGTGIDVAEYAEVDVNVPTVTPTSITPSNSSPVALSANTPVNPTANGYAIASYEEIDVPKPSHHYTIRPDMPTISRVGALEGVEQLHFHSIDPSNSDPDTITDGEIYIADGSGKAVASITDVMPSSTPTSVSMDDIVHIYGSGVIVDAMPPTPTSITPSNATPASITSGNSYTATGNGYAIESYSYITDRPFNVSANDILKANISGSVAMLQTITPSNTNPPEIDYSRGYTATRTGYVINDYDSITPSSTPEAVTAGDMVQINGSGVVVAPASLAPSNSTPALIANGETYTATASGYAISSYSSKTPSDSSPASVSSGAIIKASSSGYLYSTVQPKVKTGTFTTSTSGTTTVNCGFKPKYFAIEMDGISSSGAHSMYIYNETFSTTQYYISNASNYPVTRSFSTSNNMLNSVTNTGFIINATTSSSRTARYFAIG